MKHLHRVSFNTLSKNPKEFIYKFGQTEKVSIKVSKNAILISVKLSRIYDKEEMLSNGVYLFPDAIRKALLLHIMLFSKNISIKSITTQIDDEKDTVNLSKGHLPPIYSLVNGSLKHKIPLKWKDSSIYGNILCQTKSSYDSRMAALFALICSKSKVYESERFIYLWMAFNGMYGYLAKKISDFFGTPEIKQEYKQIIYMQKLLGVGGETICNDDKSRIANKVIAIIKHHGDNAVNKAILESCEPESISRKIKAVLKKEKDGKEYNLSAYGYILTQFSYYFRCNIIHANKPLALFSYIDDGELMSLKVINNVLEEYIDTNLPNWFDEQYIKDVLTNFVTNVKL